MNTTFLQDLLSTIAEQGRQLIPASLIGSGKRDALADLSRALLSGQGEASGVALAREILTRYRALSVADKRAFVRYIAETMRPDAAIIEQAATAYIAAPNDETLAVLQRAVESPRQEFFRRLNLAPGGTAELVALRRDLLAQPKRDAVYDALDQDLQHLFASWFNRGFLVLRRIDWNTPAAILEKIIAYEAVHEIKGWHDLRRRLDPSDRRLFAFFHPSLVDEPLIFVEVALMDETPGAIAAVLGEPPPPNAVPAQPTTAVFYSISNCQEGLRGISFGNFLIKQVVEELARERPSLKSFVTLSPVPGFTRWLERVLADDADGLLSAADHAALATLDVAPVRAKGKDASGPKATLEALAAYYFLRAKSADGYPLDPVARFHLGNGARLERINWRGDLSEKGLREAHGLMVNYRYDPGEIERNHETYENNHEVAASKAVRALLRAMPRPKSKAVAGQADAAKPESAKRLMPPGR